MQRCPSLRVLPQRSAFTLLEIVLVLALIGVLAGVTAHFLSPLRHAQSAEQAAYQLLDDILHSRDQAAREARLIRLRVDLDQGTVSSAAVESEGDAERHELGNQSQLTLRFIRRDGSEQDSGVVELLFLPDMRCVSAGIFLLTHDGMAMAVECFAHARTPRLRRVL